MPSSGKPTRPKSPKPKLATLAQPSKADLWIKRMATIVGVIFAGAVAFVTLHGWMHRPSAQAQVLVNPVSDDLKAMPHRIEFKNVGTVAAQDFRHACMVWSAGDAADSSGIVAPSPSVWSPIDELTTTEKVASDIDRCYRTTAWRVGKPPSLSDGDKIYVYLCYRTEGSDPSRRGYVFMYSALRKSFAIQANDDLATSFFKTIATSYCAGFG
jgi:hypothetical protein